MHYYRFRKYGAKKAARLCTYLRANGYSAVVVANDLEVRVRAVAATGVRDPSKQTWMMVVGLLAAYEEQEANAEPECRECGSMAEDVYLRSCGVLLCGRCNDSDAVWASMGVD